MELVRFETGTGLVVALSGGADSTALLYLCRSVLADEFQVKLTAAHLDHGLRGPEGQRDREAAEAAAAGLGVPFVWERRDCRALADHRSMSLEEAAREARYDFLINVCREAESGVLATGHTADDNAEVMLLNLFRGAGPAGLSGIPPVRKHGEISIIRPLLGFRREELKAFLTEKRISWIEDSSNLDMAFTRNRIRHDLLPELEREYNPGVKTALIRTADIIRREEAAWSEVMAGFKEQVGWRESEGRALMEVSRLAALNPAFQRRLIRAAVEAVSGGTRALSYDHIEAALKLTRAAAASPQTGQALNLPGRLDVRVEHDNLVFGYRLARGKPVFRYILPVPGRITLTEIGLTLSAEILEDDIIDPSRHTGWRAVLNPAALSPPLVVRNPEPGDRFRPLGLKGTKKLQDFFTDAHVPAQKRAETPVVADSVGIVWVGGFRIAERVRVRPGSGKAVLLALEPAGRDGRP